MLYCLHRWERARIMSQSHSDWSTRQGCYKIRAADCKRMDENPHIIVEQNELISKVLKDLGNLQRYKWLSTPRPKRVMGRNAEGYVDVSRL